MTPANCTTDMTTMPQPEVLSAKRMASSGWGIVVMSVVLFAGFMVLSFSTFQVNSVVGLLSGITILTALTLDFQHTPTQEQKNKKRRLANQKLAAMSLA